MTLRHASRMIPFACASILLLAATACAQPDAAGGRIAATELAERIEAGDAPIILDVRSEKEFAGGHIPGALNIPHDELEARIAEVPGAPSDEIVVHCQSGRRAQHSAEVLREAGYTQVRDLDGHWKAWSDAGRASE